MALASAQVIDAVAARLIGKPLVGANVYTSRAWPLTVAQLPAWKVIAGVETLEDITIHYPGVRTHNLLVECHGVCRSVDDLDDHLHALALEGHRALFDTRADATLQPLRGVLMKLHTVERSLEGEGEAALGGIVLLINVTFRTAENAPEVFI